MIIYIKIEEISLPLDADTECCRLIPNQYGAELRRCQSTTLCRYIHRNKYNARRRQSQANYTISARPCPWKLVYDPLPYWHNNYSR